MHRLSLARVIRLALGGAFGGLISFLILNPSISRLEATGRHVGSIMEVISTVFQHAMTMGAVVGLTIGCSLVVVEECQTRNIGRIFYMGVLSLIVGAVFGLVGGLIGQFAFSLFLLVSVVFARTIGWCLMGAAAGVCLGAVSKSWRRARQGILGGLIGGGIGGILFDALAMSTGTGDASRAIGFISMGTAIGAAVSLVEEFAKDAWLTVLTGAREGRSYILSKDKIVLGRDELTDIPLFGDSSVQKAHAAIMKSNGALQIVASQGLAVVVNNCPVAGAPLSNGDIIGIGKHRFRFNCTGSPGTVRQSVQAPVQQMPVNVTHLQVVSGPHTGETFQLSNAQIVIGRDPGCLIPLVRDGMASRQHARLIWDGSSWRIEDNNSTNGLYVNRFRVTSHPLRPGDEIYIGESVLRAV